MAAALALSSGVNMAAEPIYGLVYPWWGRDNRAGKPDGRNGGGDPLGPG